MKKTKRRVAGILLALVLVVTGISGIDILAADFFEVGADNHTNWDSVNDGVFVYPNGKMEISGIGLSGDEISKNVPSGTLVTVTLTPNPGCTVQGLMNQGRSLTLTDSGSDGSKVYTVNITDNMSFEPTFDSQGGSQPVGPQPGTSCIAFRIEGDACTSYSDMKSKDNSFDIYIKPENGQYMSLQELLDSGVMAFTGSEYVFDDSVNSADVYMTINTNKYMVQSAVGIGASGAITVNKGTTFIQIDNKALTITWAYDKQTYGDDAYLEHGKAYVIAIEGVNDLHSIPFANNPGDAKGGHIAVETGKKVTIKLIPDYGYQIAGVRLNGGETLTPDANNISTFTFVMGDGNVHFKGIFTKAADTISVSGSNAVGQASIQDGSNAAPSGNLRLTVADNKSYNTDSVKNMVKGATSAQAIDLTLDQIVSKGNGTNWENNITEFDKPITLNIELEDYDANYDYTVVRNHDGDIAELETSVADGSISFKTNRFSTYVIVKKAKNSSNQGTTEATTEPATTTTTTTNSANNNGSNTDSPKTGDYSMPFMAMIFVVSGMALYYVTKKKKA